MITAQRPGAPGLFCCGAATLLIGLAALFPATLRGQETPAPTSVLDKVYTDAQASRGKESYMTACSACHSEDLGGSGYAPALKGKEFDAAWRDKTVGEFVARVRKVMPPDNPGSLAPETYSDIVAFVLQENKYPAGDRELGTDPAVLRGIRMQ
jgi:polar amino acid transport system substrate-binding protein